MPARPRVSRWLGILGSALLLGVALASAPLTASAATQPPLGTATSFGVLAGSAVTNTGPTTITGDLGLSPGSSVTGFPPGAVNGATHFDDAVAVTAKTDLATAYTNAAGQPCTSTLTGDLGGRTLVPGVYCFTSSAQLTGTLTLNGGGDPNAVFIFKVGSMLTTASNSKVSIINGGPCGVFWQIGSSVTLGTGTDFVGTLLVNTSISL
ncbi:MAG: ice-binding family protein, partial [Candidatus Dormiibacterota bacterium]